MERGIKGEEWRVEGKKDDREGREEEKSRGRGGEKRIDEKEVKREKRGEEKRVEEMRKKRVMRRQEGRGGEERNMDR